MKAILVTLRDDGCWTAQAGDVDLTGSGEPELREITSGQLPAGIVSASPAWQRRQAAREIADAVSERLRVRIEAREPIRRYGHHPELDTFVDEFCWGTYVDHWRPGPRNVR